MFRSNPGRWSLASRPPTWTPVYANKGTSLVFYSPLSR